MRKSIERGVPQQGQGLLCVVQCAAGVLSTWVSYGVCTGGSELVVWNIVDGGARWVRSRVDTVLCWVPSSVASLPRLAMVLSK